MPRSAQAADAPVFPSGAAGRTIARCLQLLCGMGGFAAAPLAAEAGGPEAVVVFENETDGYPVFRIPALARATDGTLLAFCEGRAGISDAGNIDIVLKRSTDNGRSWGPLILVHDEGGSAPITIGNPTPIVDLDDGRVHLLFCRGNDRVFHTVSTDGGLSWAPRREITEGLKKPGWGWYATGPVHGVQLRHGDQAGRLVAPANHRIGPGGQDRGAFGAQVLYSDDRGESWQMDAWVEQGDGVGPNETTLAELSPTAAGGSRLYINSRDYGAAPGNRSEAFSEDGGASYSRPYAPNPHFTSPICQGSLLAFRPDARGRPSRLIFASPSGNRRADGTLWISRDEARTWAQPKLIWPGSFAYSDMVHTADDQLGLLFETGSKIDSYDSIRFLKVSGEWLDAAPPPAENPGAAFWNFGEKAPGGTAFPHAACLLDTHPDGHGLHLTPDVPLPYVEGAPSRGSGAALRFSAAGGAFVSDAASGNRFDFGPGDSFTIEALFRIPPQSGRSGSFRPHPKGKRGRPGPPFPGLGRLKLAQAADCTAQAQAPIADSFATPHAWLNR